MGHTGNMIIKDVMCFPLENSVYFGDGNGIDSNPVDGCGYYNVLWYIH